MDWLCGAATRGAITDLFRLSCLDFFDSWGVWWMLVFYLCFWRFSVCREKRRKKQKVGVHNGVLVAKICFYLLFLHLGAVTSFLIWLIHGRCTVCSSCTVQLATPVFVFIQVLAVLLLTPVSQRSRSRSTGCCCSWMCGSWKGPNIWWGC